MNSFHSLPSRVSRTTGRRSSGRTSSRVVGAGSNGGSVSGPKTTGFGRWLPSYCQKLCMGLSCGGAILAFSIHEFDASNDLGELI